MKILDGRVWLSPSDVTAYLACEHLTALSLRVARDELPEPAPPGEQAELILRVAFDPAIATKARRGEFVKCLDHFNLLQIAIN